MILSCSFCTLALTPQSDYKLNGNVENVFYRDTGASNVMTDVRCYIAINSDQNSERDKEYHACDRMETCSFAEKAMLQNIKVELWGRNRTNNDSSNTVAGIQLGGKRAKFWKQL